MAPVMETRFATFRQDAARARRLAEYASLALQKELQALADQLDALAETMTERGTASG
jgi:hypothetical protein